ncbi:BQ5605_C005g03163 [Microbotryum silenes-dioicae]|uniref:Complex III subunit 7 n=1 Tax=Microbotryum silenes-dioicae TaxID=796604 RepID=A0A2X0P5D9_9BASI|nr:BQ5605_C005g03163 [Microbotryum silenes-dioicae]
MTVLGPSLYKQVQASKGLYKFLKPFADRFASVAGYRAHGLKYDDILIEENPTVQKLRRKRARCRRARPHTFVLAPRRDRTSHTGCAEYANIATDSTPTHLQALGRLSERESYDRAFRLRTASMCAIAHQELPKDKWVPKDQDVRYLKPLVAEIEQEAAERATWDSVKRA